MTNSKIDQQIAHARRAIQRAKDKGHETAGLEARLNKLLVKKRLHQADHERRRI